MRRFARLTTLVATLALLAPPVAAQEATANAEGEKPGITVGVITNADGAHLGAYFNGLAHAPEAASVVLADPHGATAEQARKALGDKLTAVHQSRDRMLAEEKPDMALISLEARLAPEAIAAALDAGCHVLAEKPAALNAGQFQALVEKAEAADRHLMLALTNRLNPEYQKARSLIEEGALGKLYGVQLTMVKDQTRLTRKSHQDSWYADKNRAGGGHLTWLSIHWIDLAMHVTGSPITKVAGFTDNVGGQPVNIEDAVALSFQFDNGALGTLTSGYFTDNSLHTLLKVWGAKGWLAIDSDAPKTVRWYSTASGEGVTESFDGGKHNTYGAFVRAAVRASAGLEAPPITGRECLQVLEVIYGGYEASEKGVQVPVN